MDLQTYERIQPHATNAGIKFFTPTSHVLWRVQTLLTKEPDTIAWMDSLPTSDILLDIGANIGQYALYAAKRGMTVHAFEPESQNFALLCRNIVLNEMANLVTPWPLCLSDCSHLDILHLSTLTPGGSCHSFGESRDFNGNAKTFPARQGSVSTTIDEFLANEHLIPPTPRLHAKIDVDGFEHLVISGAYFSLDRFDSFQIELNTHYPQHMAVIPILENAGFQWSEEQAVAARRTEGAFAGIGNITFTRKQS